jgi:hypothetical protein
MGIVRKRDRLEDLGIDGRIILKWIPKQRNEAGAGVFWLRTGTGVGSCKCGTERSCSIKRGKYLDYTKTCSVSFSTNTDPCS